MEVKQILEYGAGLMGRGIDQIFSRNPEDSIVLYDIADNDVLGQVRKEMMSFVGQDIVDAETAEQQLSRISFTT
ncbi:3-hydroxyacyl-CoA dehydrogenase NAD-binding domain-containing protein, partial [Megasphaera stantonii]|uniref:3-hydroxyacyl-CoA dehydrogenase NAD-binding domain-containing protein n=1 Tax=Megasphaera stantonii TaxID=2144175 RepID=UPI0018E50E0A